MPVIKTMNPRVKEVVALAGHRLRLTFTNGETGLYDCTPLLGFGVFRELTDIRYFRKAAVAYGTVVWPNSQDICPDTLYLDSTRNPAEARRERYIAKTGSHELVEVCEKSATYGQGAGRKKGAGRKQNPKTTGRKPS